MARILIGNVKGPTGATGPQGAQGPRGVQGIQGPLPPLTNNFLATVAGESALDAVAGKTLQDQITQQNSDLQWKIYKDVFSLGLTKSCSTSQIIDALLSKGNNSMLVTAIFRPEYPNLHLASGGSRHLYTVKASSSGYISIADDDISNGAAYYCGHDGINFSSWNSDFGAIQTNYGAKSIASGTLIDMCNVWLSPGTYLLICNGLFGGDGAYARRLSVAADSVTVGTDSEVYAPGTLQKVTEITLNKSSNVVLSLRQDSGSPLSLTSDIHSIKIK